MVIPELIAEGASAIKTFVILSRGHPAGERSPRTCFSTRH